MDPIDKHINCSRSKANQFILCQVNVRFILIAADSQPTKSIFHFDFIHFVAFG